MVTLPLFIRGGVLLPALVYVHMMKSFRPCNITFFNSKTHRQDRNRFFGQEGRKYQSQENTLKKNSTSEESMIPREKFFRPKFNFDTGVEPLGWAIMDHKEIKIRISRRKRICIKGVR